MFRMRSRRIYPRLDIVHRKRRQSSSHTEIPSYCPGLAGYSVDRDQSGRRSQSLHQDHSQSGSVGCRIECVGKDFLREFLRGLPALLGLAS